MPTVAIVAGVAAAASAYAASEQADAAEDANNANISAERERNALNYKMFRQSRGEGGNAILPVYAKNTEEGLFNEAVRIHDATNALYGTPTDQVREATNIQARFRPGIEQGNAFLDDVLSGNLANQRINQARPVYGARRNLAATQGDAILFGLKERLNALEAQQAAKGYTGTGSFAQNRMLDATIGARQQAAGARANADLQNEMEKQAIRDQGVSLRSSMLSMPYQRAQAEMEMKELPIQMIGRRYNQSMSPFQFFNIGPGQFKYDPLPPKEPVLSTGAIVAGGIGQAAGSIGNYYATKSLINSMNTTPQTTGAYRQYPSIPANATVIDGSRGFNIPASSGVYNDWGV